MLAEKRPDMGTASTLAEASTTPRDGRSSLWNRQVMLLMAVTFLVYSNNSVFFYFYEYLGTLKINPGYFGLLIGIFSSVSLVLRPFVSSFIHPTNAYRYLYAGAVLVIGALFGYSLALGFWSMLFVRLLHGFAFVLLGSALITIMVGFMPKGRSANFFGLLAIVTIIPNSIIPPVLPILEHFLGGFSRMLICFAATTLLVFPLIKAAGSPERKAEELQSTRRLSGKEIFEDLANRRVLLTLAAMLCLYCAYALVFFYLDGYGKSIGITGTGLFLTLATASEIGIRLFAGSAFDRFDKGRTAMISMLFLAAGYALLSLVNGNLFLYFVGILLGLGWGVAMPVFNGILFDISEKKFQAFNTNLGMQIFQGGFFLGPLLFGPMVIPFGFRSLFYVSAALSVAAAVIVFSCRKEAKG
jgi:predicted MFS family arabinose efflux permease